MVKQMKTQLLYLCVCVFVFSSHSFWTLIDVPAGVTQEEGHTGFLIHLLSAVHALIFLARRIQPFLSLVDREVEFCVLTILIVLHPLGIILFFSFLVRKIPFAGIELTSQRVRRLRGTSELPYCGNILEGFQYKRGFSSLVSSIFAQATGGHEVPHYPTSVLRGSSIDPRLVSFEHSRVSRGRSTAPPRGWGGGGSLVAHSFACSLKKIMTASDPCEHQHRLRNCLCLYRICMLYCTKSGCGKREAHINWSMEFPE